MASFASSSYHKYIDLQNVSGSGDPATAPAGGVYLFASGTVGNSKLYLQNEGSSSPLDIAAGFDIDSYSAFSGVPHASDDEFLISDDGTEKRATMTMVANGAFALVSGDATVAAGGALTIANDAVEQAMIADDAVGADQLAANAVVEASIVDNAVSLAKMAGITRGSIIVGDSSGDPSLLAKGSAAQFLQSDGTDPSYVTISGDATVAAGGALTIGTGVVEHAMLAADCIDGDNIQDDVVNSEHLAAGAIDTEHIADNQVTLAKMAGLASAKLILGDSNGDPAAVTMSGDATLSNTGALTIAAGAVETAMVADDAITGAKIALFDDSLAATTTHFLIADGTDYSSFALSGDVTCTNAGVVTIANDAVEQAMIADDAVGADQLASNAVVNASVASGAAIEGTKLNLNVDMGGDFQIGNQSNDTAAFGGPIKVGGNSIVDSGNNGAVTFDGSGNTQAAGNLTVGTDGGGKQFTVHGASANEFMRYVPGDNLLKFQDGSSGTILTLGGDATTEYAVDVTEGSNNINKIRAAAFVTYSDESLKQDVQTMNTALDTVMSLNGVEFTWKNSGERDFGFIAQDVQAVLPKAVHTAQDGVQGVDYSRLTSVLVEAVKAQQVQIEELKSLLKK